jgi:phosphohistidine phosphatase
MRLYILRHAKSELAAPGMKDFDRGLGKRGADQLRQLVPVMRERNYLPKQVYSSPALRTRLTMHGIILAYGIPPKIDYVDKLYSGDTLSYVDCVRRHPVAEDIMIIGHNPMCAELAVQLVADGKTDALQVISQRFPTGALAVIDFDLPGWNEIGVKSGYLADFFLPAGR